MIRNFAKFFRSPLREESGFSYVDVLLATVVLMLGVLALASLQSIATTSNKSSQSTSAALAVAEAKIELMKGAPFTSIVSEAATSVTSAGLTFTRTVTVTNDSPIPGSKTVKVTVTWTDSRGSHSIPIATVIAAPL